MKLDPGSFVLGVLFTAVIVLILHFVMFLLKPWRHAFFSGTPVPMIAIIGMRLRGNPPMLLIEAYGRLRRSGVETSMSEVEAVYLQDRGRGPDVDALVELVRHYRRERGA